MLSLAVLTLISAATADLAEADEARAAKAGEHHATALRMARRVTAAPDQPHLRDALPHFRLAVRLAPSNADYQSNLGVAEMRVGSISSAKRRFTRALAANPAHAAARANLEWAHDLLSPQDAMRWSPRQGGKSEYVFGTLRQKHTVLRLPRIPIAQLSDPRWEQHRNGKLPFIVTGLVTEENGWDVGFWRKANMTRTFASTRVDFYPHNMGDEKVNPLFTSLQNGWDELDFPTQTEQHVDTSEPGTYIQWNVMPEDWDKMRGAIGKLPQLAVLDDEWVPACFGRKDARASFFRQAHWRMLLIGERGAGMFNHKDTLRVSSWQAQLSGTKRWHLCEGDTQDGFMYGAGDVNAFAPDYEKYPLFANAKCYQEEVKAGEFIFYPRDYWHQTQNLEHHTMSLSGSVVDAYNWETSIREFDTECTAGRIMHPQEGDGVCDGLRTCFDLWEEKFTKPGATKELKR